MFPFFTNSTRSGKLFLRFIILPFVSSLSSSAQMHFVKSTPRIHVDYVIPMLWITSGFLKIFERLFTNSMFQNGDYQSLVGLYFGAALVEIFSHCTYMKRIMLMKHILKYISRMQPCLIRRKRTVALRQLQGVRESAGATEANTEFDWVFFVRQKMIIEDITIEIMMVFTVSFILFFIHPLVNNASLQTIPDFGTCALQLVIQLLFEMMSDIFGLYWATKKDGIVLTLDSVSFKDSWFWIWVLFLLWQSLRLCGFYIEAK